nr:MAG TPA: minor structural protein [Caudoviricetes sp.]
MITLLNSNGVTVQNFVNEVSEGVPYFEPTLTENIESLVSKFSFYVPLDCEGSEQLIGLNKILTKDKDGDLRQFVITHTEEIYAEVGSQIYVEAEDFSITEMNDTVVPPFVAATLADAMYRSTKDTGWNVEYATDTYQDVQGAVSTEGFTNMREAMSKIREAFDVEFKFTVKIDPFNTYTRTIKVYKSRGVQTGRYFYYGRDLLGITREVDYTGIKTAILPYYSADNVDNKTLASFLPTNPLEGFTKDYTSPLVVHEEAHAEYDAPTLVKAMPFKASATTPELVYRQACEELLKYVAPKYTYTVNVILLNRLQGWEGETLSLGDTVWLKERVGSREIGLEARVIEYVYHEDDPSLDEVTFTNFREIDTYDTDDIAGIRDALRDLSDQVGSNTVIIESTREQISKLEEGQAGIITDLNGKNSISIGDTPKPNPIDGDTWFSTRVNEAGQTIHEIKVWDGVEKVWKLSMDTSKAFEAEDTAKAAQKDAEESLEKANQAVEDAENAVVIGEGNTAKIITMEEAINLRVEKDDVINQINVSKEGIIIDGAKVQITGKTYIEDAVITDAMVSDLSASKLTAGVIDASKINVTNLDASNLKAGTIQGIDITGSTITGSEFITKWDVQEINSHEIGEGVIKKRMFAIENKIYVAEDGVETLRRKDLSQVATGGIANVAESYDPATGYSTVNKTVSLSGGYLGVSSIHVNEPDRNSLTTIQDTGIIVNGKKQFSSFYGNGPIMDKSPNGTLLRIGPFMGTDFNTSTNEHNDLIWFNSERSVMQFKRAGTFKFDINLRHQGDATSSQSKYVYTLVIRSDRVDNMTSKGEVGYIGAVGNLAGGGALNYRYIGMGSFVIDVPKDWFIGFRLSLESGKYSFITNVPSLQITEVFKT